MIVVSQVYEDRVGSLKTILENSQQLPPESSIRSRASRLSLSERTKGRTSMLSVSMKISPGQRDIRDGREDSE